MAGALMAIGALSAPANAAPPAPVAAAATAAATPERIECRSKGWVKMSTRRMKVHMAVTCSSEVPKIKLTLKVRRNGKVVKSKTFVRHGDDKVKGTITAKVRCGRSTKYKGSAQIRVTLPEGYTPPVLKFDSSKSYRCYWR